MPRSSHRHRHHRNRQWRIPQKSAIEPQRFSLSARTCSFLFGSRFNVIADIKSKEKTVTYQPATQGRHWRIDGRSLYILPLKSRSKPSVGSNTSPFGNINHKLTQRSQSVKSVESFNRCSVAESFWAGNWEGLCFGKSATLHGRKGINQLRSYKRVNGDANVPIMHVCSNGFRLGHWLHGQKRIGKRLPPDRLKALQDCGVELD